MVPIFQILVQLQNTFLPLKGPVLQNNFWIRLLLHNILQNRWTIDTYWICIFSSALWRKVCSCTNCSGVHLLFCNLPWIGFGSKAFSTRVDPSDCKKFYSTQLPSDRKMIISCVGCVCVWVSVAHSNANKSRQKMQPYRSSLSRVEGEGVFVGSLKKSGAHRRRQIIKSEENNGKIPRGTSPPKFSPVLNWAKSEKSIQNFLTSLHVENEILHCQ